MFHYFTDESRQDGESVPFASWDDENVGNNDFDIPTYINDAEEPGTLIRPPRQVCTSPEP